MLKPIVFANAFTTIWVVAYVICLVFSALTPELIHNISKSWIHTLNLEAVQVTGSLDLGSSIFGAVTFGVFVWVISYAGAALYNRWSK